MNKSVVEVLTDARAKVQQGWNTGCLARDKSGCQVDPLSPNACSWCAEGALWTPVETISQFNAAAEFIGEVVRELHHVRLVQFNDAPGRTQAEVLDLFTRAIERAKCSS